MFKFKVPRKEKEMFNILGYHAVKQIRFSACAGRWVGQRGQGKSRGLYFFCGKGNENHDFGTGFLHTTEYYQHLRE